MVIFKTSCFHLRFPKHYTFSSLCAVHFTQASQKSLSRRTQTKRWLPLLSNQLQAEFKLPGNESNSICLLPLLWACDLPRLCTTLWSTELSYVISPLLPHTRGFCFLLQGVNKVNYFKFPIYLRQNEGMFEAERLIQIYCWHLSHCFPHFFRMTFLSSL